MQTGVKLLIRNPPNVQAGGFLFIDLARTLHESFLKERKLYLHRPMLPEWKFYAESFHKMKRVRR